MKKKQIDAIWSQVFESGGELRTPESGTPADRERVLAEVTRGAIAGLREIPECQLTKDHLRHAVLNRGVEQRPRSSWAVSTIGAAAGIGLLGWLFASFWFSSDGAISPSSSSEGGLMTMAVEHDEPLADRYPIERVAPDLTPYLAAGNLVARLREAALPSSPVTIETRQTTQMRAARTGRSDSQSSPVDNTARMTAVEDLGSSPSDFTTVALNSEATTSASQAEHMAAIVATSVAGIPASQMGGMMPVSQTGGQRPGSGSVVIIQDRAGNGLSVAKEENDLGNVLFGG